MRRHLAFLLLALAAGCENGSTGDPGDPGPGGDPGGGGLPGGQAPPGLEEFSPLPGVVVIVDRVAGATGADGTFQVGDTVAVTFHMTYGNGARLLLKYVDFFEIYVYGPTTNYQPVLARRTDVLTKAVENADGTYTYTFPSPIPANYLAPANDSTALQFDPGARASEMTGRPLLPGTYSVGIAAYKSYTLTSGTFRDAGNAVFHFLLGGATTIEPREIVVEADCATCHNELRLHGGFRRKPELCVMCHTAGAEDRTSADPEKATAGATIDFRVMIHKIHRGRELRAVDATANAPEPWRYQLIGNSERVHDYSDVAFPQMPGGTGFNQQTRNCEACHGNAGDADAWYTRPSRAACGACHDDVDFSDGTRLAQGDPLVSAGTLDRDDLGNPAFREIFHIPQADDSSCIGCHADTVPTLGIRHVHKPPLLTADAEGTPGVIGLQVELLNVLGATGPGGSFLPGDTVQVQFRVKDGAGALVSAESTSAITGVMSGPTGNYQRIIPTSTTSSTVNLRTGLTGTGPFTVTLGSIPANFPRQLNESKRSSTPASYPGYAGGDPFTFEDGWGELKNQPLVAGTYTIYVWGARQFVRSGVTYREATLPALRDVLVSTGSVTATTIEPHAAIVSDAKCNSCHLDLRFHGSGRRGVQGCILCHTSGAEDRARSGAGVFEAPEPDTIDFRVMIHRIHIARELTLVQEGGVYDLAGFSGTPEGFSTGDLPAMPGGARNCGNCHSNDAWKNPTERSDVRIWMKTCTSCHDSPEALAHVGVNTVGTTTTGNPATTAQEACAVCHGPGAEFAVDKVHIPR